MSKYGLTVVSFFLLITGSLLLWNGGLIRVKAVIAQYLLAGAWDKSRQTGEVVKPWPWADTWPVGRLYAVRADLAFIVLAGDSGEVLAFGPGHLSRSALPGSGGHSILVGHRDTSFAFLEDLVAGDSLILEGKNGRQNKYIVQSSAIKKADELYFDLDVADSLTLITCFPFAAIMPGGDMRYVVSASKEP